jgi:hypothetical protein
LITALALVLALAVAVPTIGAQKNNIALRTAKQAKQIAKTAKSQSKKAKRAANGAQATATSAQATADTAQSRIDALASKTDTDAGSVTTGNESAYQDLGGPSVTVNVPESGLVEVWAQVTTADGLVSLYEDGQQVGGQDPNNACGALPGGLLSVQTTPAVTVATGAGFGLFGCGSTGPPAPVLFETSSGQHTYSLRYADCGCDPADATFEERTLTVAPRP